MGVDARILVKLAAPIDDAAVVDAAYRLAEACARGRVFWFSNDEDLARGEMRRALNRITAEGDEYYTYGVAERDGTWLHVSLWGRYYGPGYERGDLWAYIAIAEWLERNFAGCMVFYGGDSGETLEPFNRPARERFVAHWAEKGGRPYYAGEGRSRTWCEPQHPLRPTCPLCQRLATQYGSGGAFASWTCDGCSRHWVWVGGDVVKGFPPSSDFDSFAAAKEMRASATPTDAVDPVGGRVTG